eukprot:g13176.t2
MSRSREELEDDLIDEVFPATKKQRLGGDDHTHTSYGSRRDEDGHESTFAINYDDDDFDDDPDAVDDAASPSGGGSGAGGGATGGGAVIRKGKNKPWKVHRRVGGGSMHDANLYRRYRPDFRELAREYPDTFGPHVRDDPETGRASIDWADPAAMRELTRVMLRHDFGLPEWDAPLDRLCPPVANRLNYICWLSDLMKLSASSESRPSPAPAPPPPAGGGAVPSSGAGGDEAAGESAMSAAQRNLLLFGTTGGVAVGAEDGMEVCDDGEAAAAAAVAAAAGEPKGRSSCRGIDVGTGASCIYPLLGAKVAGWSFLATEIDGVSAEWAEKNVRSNGLQDQITVRLVPPASDGNDDDDDDDDTPGPLLTALRDEDGKFDFSMTNPPFFESTEEAGQNPDTATGEMATAGEVACPGGEVAFVRAIIRDSLRLRERVRWYTSMVGKKSNAKRLLRVLREAGVKNTRTTEFFQGRTVRWGLAWSFTSEGMIGNKVPDDPSVKVFSKKKAADRTQHNLRTFSVPLRPHPSSLPPPSSVSPFPAGSETAAANGTPSCGAAGAGPGSEGGGAGKPGGLRNPTVSITVPANLPVDAGDVVERLKRSVMAFKQTDVKMEAADEDDIVGSSVPPGERRFRCEARRRGVAAGDAAARGSGASTAAAPPPSASIAAATTGTDGAPLFAFELEVHCAAEWAGPAAAQAAVQVWARLEDGGDRAAFQRLWEVLQMDVLRQNRRWRREMSREAAGGAR